MLAAVVEAASPVEGDARAVELRVAIPGGAGLDVGALPDGEETGAGAAGADVGVVDVWVGVGVVDVWVGVGVVDVWVGVGVVDVWVGVGVVDVWVGAIGDATGVELRVVIPGGAGLDVGALPDGEETGAGSTGDDVGVVDVWVGSIGDATGVESPVGGADVGGCGEAGVGVAFGG